MALFHEWGSIVSRLQSHYEEAVYFLRQIPRYSWNSFDQPQMDESLSQSWSHRMVLNIVPLDWESSTSKHD